eukprot:tig00000857_g4943.t1
MLAASLAAGRRGAGVPARLRLVKRWSTSEDRSVAPGAPLRADREGAPAIDAEALSALRERRLADCANEAPDRHAEDVECTATRTAGLPALSNLLLQRMFFVAPAVGLSASVIGVPQRRSFHATQSASLRKGTKSEAHSAEAPPEVGVTEQGAAEVPPKKRGRPSNRSAEASTAQAAAAPASPPRGRRKNATAAVVAPEPAPESSASAEAAEAVNAPAAAARRGRPKKTALEAPGPAVPAESAEGPTGAPQRRGRPKKAAAEVATPPVPEAEAPRRGRPKKPAAAAAEPAAAPEAAAGRRGRPKEAAASVAEPGAPLESERGAGRRGRPQKAAAAPAEVPPTAEAAGVAVVGPLAAGPSASGASEGAAAAAVQTGPPPAPAAAPKEEGEGAPAEGRREGPGRSAGREGRGGPGRLPGRSRTPEGAKRGSTLESFTRPARAGAGAGAGARAAPATFTSRHFTLRDSEVVDFLRRKKLRFEDQGKTLRVAECPFCSHSIKDDTDRNTLVVSKESGAFHCHRGSCGAQGSWYDFKSRLSGGMVDTKWSAVYSEGSGALREALARLAPELEVAAAARRAAAAADEARRALAEAEARAAEAAERARFDADAAEALGREADAEGRAAEARRAAEASQAAEQRARAEAREAEARRRRLEKEERAARGRLDAALAGVRGARYGRAGAEPGEEERRALVEAAARYLVLERGLEPGALTDMGVAVAVMRFKAIAYDEDGSSRGEDTWEACALFPMHAAPAAPAHPDEPAAPAPPAARAELVRVKVRSMANKAHMRLLPQGGAWGLFGFDRVRPDDSRVVITEGEYDALAVYQATGQPALSLPNGATSLPPAIIEQLERFEEVVLWMDDDAAGHTGAEKFAQKLGSGRCSVVRSRASDLQGPKDANDALRQRGPAAIRELLERAEPVPHGKIAHFDAFRSDVMREFQMRPPAEDGADSDRRLLREFWNKYLKGLRPGELTIWSGPTGAGKTTLLSQIALNECIASNTPTLWGSFEVKNARLIKKMITQLAGQSLEGRPAEELGEWMDHFSQLPMYFLKYHGSTEIDDILDAMEHAWYRHDVGHIVLDNLQFLLSGQSKGLDKFDLQDDAIKKLRAFATEKHVHISLVVHPRKEPEERELAISSIFGGVKTTQEADNVVILQRRAHPLANSDCGETIDEKFLDVKKNRFDGAVGRTALVWEERSQCYLVARSGEFREFKREVEGRLARERAASSLSHWQAPPEKAAVPRDAPRAAPRSFQPKPPAAEGPQAPRRERSPVPA